jgi:DNA-binding PadR family transcriptional regulator
MTERKTMRITTSVAAILAAFLQDPAEGHYGLGLMRATGQPSGTLYPILVRLQDAGWVDAHWEDIDPVAAGRPARRYYRLTPDGVVAARRELQALQRKIGMLGKLAEGSA